MTNLIVFPIIIPLITAAVLFFFRHQIILQKILVLIGMLATVCVSGYLVQANMQEGIQVLHVGGWQAPFGISLVADMFASLLTLASSLVGLAVLLYAFDSTRPEREHMYFYPMMLFLITGVNGSFLTGDIFNLFVFFEVMLIASYVLLSLGGKKLQLQESIKYLIINVVVSSFFVVAIAFLYSMTGTLNFAHLAERVAESGQTGLLTTVSLLFLMVFSLKAGLFLFFWLPGSYGAPPAAVSAIFAALLTKVGIYSIIRLFTLVFYHEPQITHTIMMWMGALTMLLGGIGAVAYWEIKKILNYNVIISVGFIIFGVATATASSLSGALYYLLHDIFAKGLIFILGGAIISVAGTDKLRDIKGLVRYRPILSWLFFISALALAGVPPLSGFTGKLLILQGGVQSAHYPLVVVGILSSLFVLYSVMKIFIHSFWGETLMSEGEEKAKGRGIILAGFLLTGIVIAMGVGSEFVLSYVNEAVKVLIEPSLYIEAVLYN